MYLNKIRENSIKTVSNLHQQLSKNKSFPWELHGSCPGMMPVQAAKAYLRRGEMTGKGIKKGILVFTPGPLQSLLLIPTLALSRSGVVGLFSGYFHNHPF